MTDNPIPPDVRDFILNNIGTVAELEALLMLRSEPGRAWSASILSMRLYMPEQKVAEILTQLERKGIFSVGQDGYRYAPRTEEISVTIERLARTYERALIPVTNLIHSSSYQLRKFADAFKFRTEE